MTEHDRFESMAELYALGALERDEDERAAYLEDACAGDANLRMEVESMLDAHTESHALLIENKLVSDGDVALPDPLARNFNQPADAPARYRPVRRPGPLRHRHDGQGVKPSPRPRAPGPKAPQSFGPA